MSSPDPTIEYIDFVEGHIANERRARKQERWLWIFIVIVVTLLAFMFCSAVEKSWRQADESTALPALICGGADGDGNGEILCEK